MYATVLIMSPKAQFVKCKFYVILYIIVCLILLKIKYFYAVQQQERIVVKYIREREKCVSNVSDVSKNSINAEIRLLEDDVMNGQSINAEESAAILRKVSDVCVRGKLKTPLINRHFLYGPRHKSLYCWIRKVASTSFTKLFSDMTNDEAAEKHYRSSPTLQILKDLQLIAKDISVFKLLVVRHPFQRLVSSYRDRIEDNSRHTAQAWIYTKKIFRLTRPKLFRSNTTTGNFMQKVFTADRRLKVIPTFREFVQWLLQSPEEDDVHWDRYYTHCAVCNISYNYILKLDEYTFGEINYIFSKLQLDVDQMYLPKLEQTRGGHTDFDTACKYYKTLTRDMIFKLYEKYKVDFEMYNYDYEKYMFCVNKKV